ncbi:MAG: BNR-4 repeat-containing protein, partial [Patescibacteria group bacterium]|nr:BNR-4 repeat-containing protein [Patescibacteria group bacterium]
KHWKTGGVEPIELPITLARGDVIDPIPPGGGLINGNTYIGFDTQGRVIVTYHKHDANGHTQIYNARREADGWRIYQATDWQYRWEFEGGGSIHFEIGVAPVEVAPDGTLEQSYRHAKYGSGRWRLDEATLRPVDPAPRRRLQPGEIGRLRSDFPGMQVRRAADQGQSGDATIEYLLRWETLAANRDRPREGDLPSPSSLRLYKLVTP